MSNLGGHGPAVIAVLVTETVISAIFIGLRWYTRRVLKGALGVDDYFLALTWLFVLTYTILYVVACLAGFGEHLDNLEKPDIRRSTFIFLVAQCVASVSMGLSKAAVCLFLLRLVIQTWHRIFVWFWLLSYSILSAILAAAIFTQCTPVQSLWDDRVAPENCPIQLTKLAVAVCAWSVAIDFSLAIFPWHCIWPLNMPKKERLSICFSLSLGVFAGACGIARTLGLNKLDDPDILYASAEPVMWTSSETCLTILCVTIPSLRPLFRRVFYGYVDGGSDKRSYAQQGSRSMGFRPNNGYEMNTVVRGNMERLGDESDSNNRDEVDNRSDRSILNKPQGVIQRVQHFSVSYNTNK